MCEAGAGFREPLVIHRSTLRTVAFIFAMLLIAMMGLWVMLGPISSRMIGGVMPVKWLGLANTAIGAASAIIAAWWLVRREPILVADEQGIRIRRVFRSVSIPWDRYGGVEIVDGKHGERLRVLARNSQMSDATTRAECVAWIAPRWASMRAEVLRDSIEAYASNLGLGAMGMSKTCP